MYIFFLYNLWFRHRWLDWKSMSEQWCMCWCSQWIQLWLHDWLRRDQLWNKWDKFKYLNISFSYNHRFRHRWLHWKSMSEQWFMHRCGQWIQLQLCVWLWREQLWNKWDKFKHLNISFSYNVWFRHKWLHWKSMSEQRCMCWCSQWIQLWLWVWLWRDQLWNKWDKFKRLSISFSNNLWFRHRWLHWKSMSEQWCMCWCSQWIQLQLCVWFWRNQLRNKWDK